MKQLSDRKKLILCCAIEDYIKDASPITSSAVKDRYIQDISTATLRNELNALEAMGYLKQLHTSGGRVPTTEGYRYYVSSLLENFNVSEHALKNVQNALSQKTGSVKDILAQVASLVSEATNYPTVLIANGYDKLVIEAIKIIPLIGGEALVLFKTQSGVISNSIKTTADEKSCDDAGVFLTRKFYGKTVGELISGTEIYTSLAEVETFKNIVDSLIEGMKSFISKNHMDIHGNAVSQFLNENEQQSVVETKKVLNLLEDKQGLCDMVGNSDQLTITLGDENEKIQGCALIKAPIIINGAQIAQVAVVGPERMDYSSIASALKIVMDELNNQK